MTLSSEIFVKRVVRSVAFTLFSSRTSDIELFKENQERLEKAGMALHDNALYGSKTGIATFKRLRARTKKYVEATCPECGSTNVVVRPQVQNLLCNDCGRISYTVRRGVRVSSLYTSNR